MFDTGMAIVLVALYLWVGARASESGSVWRPGALCGLGLAGTRLVVGFLTAGFPGLGVLRPLAQLAAAGLTTLAGVLGARPSGHAADGALAGFWCGLVAAVFVSVVTLAVDNVFAATLIHTTWAHDPTCPQPAGAALAGCEIGDDLGLIGIELTALPLLLPCIAAFGGALAAISPHPVEPRPASDVAGSLCFPAPGAP